MSADANAPFPPTPEENARDGADAERSQSNEATVKPNGLGEDGTIPNHPGGVAAGHSEDPSHFNPEEDEDAT